MDERLKFIAGLLDGEKMAVLCRRFGVSRKTGYKILDRYNSCGLEGLTDRSRRPYRHANQLPVQIETLIVRSKQERPHWGAPKIRQRLARVYPDIHTPAISTVHAVLDRHGLVKRKGRRRNKATGTPLSASDQPNDLWCADYKGEFMLADRRYCYPLTITDFASRYLIACEALQSTKEVYAFTVRPAKRHPHRQRRPLCKPQCALQPVPTLGLVAQARDRDVLLLIIDVVGQFVIQLFQVGKFRVVIDLACPPAEEGLVFAEAVAHAGEFEGVAYFPKAGGHCLAMCVLGGVFSIKG
jgi:transposase